MGWLMGLSGMDHIEHPLFQVSLLCRPHGSAAASPCTGTMPPMGQEPLVCDTLSPLCVPDTLGASWLPPGPVCPFLPLVL